MSDQRSGGRSDGKRAGGARGMESSKNRYSGKRWMDSSSAEAQTGGGRGYGKNGVKRNDREEGPRRDSRGEGYRREDFKRNDREEGYRRDSRVEGYRREDRGEGYRREDFKRNDHEEGYRRDSRGEGYRREDFKRNDREGGPRRNDHEEGYRREDFKKNDREEGPRRDSRGEGYRREDNRTADRAPHTGIPTDGPAQQAGGADELPFLIIGRNAVREAVKSGRSIDRILVSSEQDGSLREIVNLARDAKLVIREVDRKKLDELCMPFGHGGRTANHQGIIAYAAGMEYCTIADILQAAKGKGEEPFVVVLDGVEDPHNLGSIIRSAECAGAHGVIIGKRRSASVTAAAVKAAAGATAYMRVARVVNVSGALGELKRAGLWVAGADMNGAPMDRQRLGGSLALVIGGEGGGLTKLVRETCDFLVSIPMRGQINSLNAGVAAAVLMFEKRRQDAAQD